MGSSSIRWKGISLLSLFFITCSFPSSPAALQKAVREVSFQKKRPLMHRIRIRGRFDFHRIPTGCPPRPFQQDLFFCLFGNLCAHFFGDRVTAAGIPFFHKGVKRIDRILVHDNSQKHFRFHFLQRTPA